MDTAALLRACRVVDRNQTGEPNLEVAAGTLGLPVHTPHHALGDAFTTAEVFLALATRLERASTAAPARPLTVRHLCDLSRHHRR